MIVLWWTAVRRGLETICCFSIGKCHLYWNIAHQFFSALFTLAHPSPPCYSAWLLSLKHNIHGKAYLVSTHTGRQSSALNLLVVSCSLLFQGLVHLLMDIFCNTYYERAISLLDCHQNPAVLIHVFRLHPLFPHLADSARLRQPPQHCPIGL